MSEVFPPSISSDVFAHHTQTELTEHQQFWLEHPRACGKASQTTSTTRRRMASVSGFVHRQQKSRAAGYIKVNYHRGGYPGTLGTIAAYNAMECPGIQRHDYQFQRRG